MTDGSPRTTPSAYDVEAEDGLLFGCVLDGQGGGALCSWGQAEAWAPGAGALWLHLDTASPRVERWLRDGAGLPGPAVAALLARETRPRSFRIDNGLLTILRGVNLNPGAEPEDMVAIRMWVEPHRIFTVRHEKLLTPRDLLASLIETRTGPHDAPSLFVGLADKLVVRMNDVIIDIEDRLDALEEQVEHQHPGKLRSGLADLRQECVALRRYLSPQREAFSNLQLDAPDWLDTTARMTLRETTDRTLRYLEDLDAARDRAIVVLDELANKMAEMMNRTMYALSIVTAIFLPLSFLTGLLGINVGGMPGVNSTVAFWITCGIMALPMTIEVILLRRLKWI